MSALRKLQDKISQIQMKLSKPTAQSTQWTAEPRDPGAPTADVYGILPPRAALTNQPTKHEKYSTC